MIYHLNHKSKIFRHLFHPFGCLFFLLISSSHINGQDSIAVLSGNLLEELIGNDDEQTYDFFTLVENLETYLNDPLNINEAEEIDFEALGILSERQIRDIINHREKYGDFLSPYELQSIPSLDFGTLFQLMPLVSSGSEINRKNILDLVSSAQHNIVLKYERVLEEKKGYTERATSPYLGDPNQFYVRYNMNSGRNLRAGLTMEKDAGEEFFTGSNKQGFDYYSGFLYFKDIHPLVRTLNIGDFTVSMGQGLILHNSFGGNKTSYVMNVKKGGQVIRPYSSVNEFNYFRGLATTLQLHDNVRLSLFASSKKVDGNISDQDTTMEDGFAPFSSFAINGFHRPSSEIDKEAAITQTNFGGSLKYRPNSRLRFGLNALNTNFSNPLVPGDDTYRIYDFRGEKLNNISLDYSYRYENFNLFGEVARSDNGGMAQIYGALVSMGRNIDMSLVYRDYDINYQVLNPNAFGERSRPINEKGIYLSLLFKPFRNFTVSSYMDLWKNPWLKFKVNAPSDGREFLTKLEYRKKRKYNIYLQYRFEQKGENSNVFTDGVRQVVDKSQHRIRLNFTNQYSKELSLVSRVEYNHFNKDGINSQGYLLFQDLKYNPIGKNYSFAARYSIFDTDNFDTRIYAYENDVLYEFSVPFFEGSGTRFYLKAKYNINRNMYVQLRYARTYFNNEKDRIDQNGNSIPNVIGSSNEEILGNSRNDIKLVLKYTIR